jgi:uncharacterized SAM-binding protein YcdF (DUF218 family)
MRYILGSLAGGLLIFFMLDAWRYARALPDFSKDALPKEKVDMIAVVTGGQGRLKKALDLFEQGHAEHLMISGVAPGSKLESILSNNGFEKFPEEWRDKIFLGSLARSTSENAKEIKGVIAEHDFDSLLLVTSSYHMPRLVRLLEKELERWPAKKVELYYARVESPNFPEDSWWLNPTAWYLFSTEYLKSLTLLLHLDSVI